ncbi:MBG domain-containing protein [Paraburkholderia sp. ZP32-5]|uniref:MBG domain-containing protein n=1 Tax=Paraburkholderia sp. ZP32-5 TaxID=2883245 RepID=UPI001F201286|nr:MBG domain-containing protein [Paraburkholderia sp. ZP32-5]
MNHAYRVVWNASQGIWQAVSELARASGGKSGRSKAARRTRAMVVALFPLGVALPAWAAGIGATALPTGGTVTSGAAGISRSGSSLTVNQTSQNASLGWQSFNIGSQATVNFVQPNAQAVAVNRIGGSNGSVILGHLNANGQVFLINPNGVLFGKGAQVNVGGLVASTLDVSDDSIGSGSLTFSGSGTGSVINRGTITAAPGGYVALVGNRVMNVGTIGAQLGSVALAGGSAVTLSFDSNRLVNVLVDQSTLNNLVKNGELIEADGGHVWMTAGAKDSLLASVVNNTGKISAQTVQNRSGTITLLAGMEAGTTSVGGTLDASAPHGGNGGAIETSGGTVHVADGTKGTTLASLGLAGTWLIDPNDFTVAANGGDMSGAELSSLIATNGGFTIESSTGRTAGSGNINVDDNVSWSANTLTLTAANNVNVNATMTASGSGGLVINTATANGSDAAVAGGTLNVGMDGNGFTGRVQFTGTDQTLMINGNTYTLIGGNYLNGQSSAAAALQAVGSTGYYALASNVDLSSIANFTPIGTFMGVFDGLGNTISNLTINSGDPYVGLFGQIGQNGEIGGVVRNVGLVGGRVAGSAGNSFVGALAGWNYGTISNAYATEAVSDGAYIGGLAGVNFGTISNAYATGVVSGGSIDGGLVGWSIGTISNAHASGAVSDGSDTGGLVGANDGTISNAYATGVVSGGGGDTGGLVGENGGTISNVYATGAVSGGMNVGGLAGENGGTISNAYATGAVSAGTYSAGGLVGRNDSTISDVYATGAVSESGGLWGVGGLVGVNFGTISNAYATGAVSESGQSSGVGGLVGQNYSGGTISNAYATGAVSAGANFAGGLVGNNDSTISNAYATGAVSVASYALGGGLVGANYGDGTISNAYATGAVSGPSSVYVGGLVGVNNGTINNAYATGAVSGDFFSTLGGLVGMNNGGGTISNAYATGAVSGGFGSLVGGLVGSNGGPVSNSYWDITTTGQSNGSGDVVPLSGATGLTTADLEAALPTGFSSSIWGNANNQTTPYLLGLAGNQVFTVNDTTATLYTVIQNAAQLQGIQGNLAGYYVLGNAIDAGATSGWNGGAGFAPLGNGTTSFTGVFDGLGFTIGNLTINDSSDQFVGLFGEIGSGGIVRNVGLAGGSVAGSAANADIGGLAGENNGSISNAYMTGAVSGASFTEVGGLVGVNGGSGTISNAYTAGAVSGGISSDVGGVVGMNNGGGTISNAYATGAVSGGISSGAGGLVGENNGSISNAYATGLVSGRQASSVGGLVGWNNGTISNAYATGAASGVSSDVGGLVGVNNGAISSSYWDITSTGQNVGVGGGTSGGTGLTTTQWMTDGPIATGASGWDAATWVPGYPYPVLASLPYIVITASGTQIYGAASATAAISSIADQNGNDASSVVGTGSLMWLGLSSNVGTGNLGGAGATASGYQIAYEGADAITPAPLTITASSDTMTYGGAVPTVTASYSGFVNGDTSASLTTAPGVSTTATASSSVGSYATTASGAIDPNYTITYQSGTVAITSAPLTITASSGTMTYGSAVPTFTASYSGFVNGDSAASLTTAPGVSTAATSASSVGAYATTASGAIDPNYTITYQSGSLTINPAPLTITASSGTMTYGSAVPTITASYSGFVNGDSAASLTTAPGLSTTATSASPVGTYATTASGAVDPNYTITYQSGSLTVNPAPLTITASSGTMTYGSAVPTVTASYSGFVNGDTAASLTTAPGLSTTATSASSVGSYATTASGAIDPNYTITYQSGAVTVTPAPLTITASSGTSTYGSAVPTFTASYSGFVNGDSAASLTTAPGVSTTATASSSVGTYATTASGALDPNYTITYQSGTLTVNPAPLTITAGSGTMTYGSAVPTFTASYSGFVNGDTAASLTTAPGVSTTASASSSVGSYATTVSGAIDPNYTITYQPGALTVTPAPLTITASNASTTYNGTAYSGGNGVTYSGFVNGDTASSLSGSLVYGGTAQGAANARSYTLTASGLSDGNYSITYVGGTLTIAPAVLTATLTGTISKTYDGTTTAALGSGNYVLSGFVGGQGATVTQTSGAYNSADVATAGTVTATLAGGDFMASGGTNLANYVLPTSASGTASITPATLTVTGTSVSSKTYDGTTAAALTGGTLSGVIGADNVTLAQSGAFASRDAGTGIAVTASDTLGGAAAGNYTLLEPTALTGTITPATLTYTANPASTHTGQLPADLGGTVTGFVNGDTLASATTGTLEWTTQATGSSQPGHYAIDGAGLVANDGNYVFTEAAGNTDALTVKPAGLPIGAANAVATLQQFALKGNAGEAAEQTVEQASAATATPDDSHAFRSLPGMPADLFSPALQVVSGGVRMP